MPKAWHHDMRVVDASQSVVKYAAEDKISDKPQHEPTGEAQDRTTGAVRTFQLQGTDLIASAVALDRILTDPMPLQCDDINPGRSKNPHKTSEQLSGATVYCNAWSGPQREEAYPIQRQRHPSEPSTSTQRRSYA